MPTDRLSDRYSADVIARLERENESLRRAVTKLHDRAVSALFGWKQALPHGDDLSVAVHQDRLAIRDMLKEIDRIKDDALKS